MPSIKSLSNFLKDNKDNALLAQAAGTIMLSTSSLPYAKSIYAIDGLVNLNTLEQGYYLRFIDRGNGLFHLYGVEVISKGDIVVHENIPLNHLENHSDTQYKDQLLKLNNEGRIYYRVASSQGGGMDLHEDLAVYYAQNGTVQSYVNSRFCQKINISKPIAHRDSSGDQPRPTSTTINHPTQTRNHESGHTKQLENTFSASNFISLGFGVLSALGGLALITGILSIVGLITVIAPAATTALFMGGAIALVAGVSGFGFFGSSGANKNTTDPDCSNPSNLNNHGL